MTMYESKDETTKPKEKPIKRPINVHIPTHERFFRLRDLQRSRTQKPGMIAEDFLVDLMDLFEELLTEEADATEAPE